jgi:hypothetical protein
MIRTIVFTALFGIYACAATLLNQNVYERENRVDLMLSFDSTFEGKISRDIKENRTLITLTDAVAEKRYVKELSHPFVEKIQINRSKLDVLKVYFYTKGKTDIIAAKTGDGYGLRLRVVPGQSAAAAQPQATQTQPVLGFETKEELQISTSYIVTIIALVAIALILFILKRKVASGSGDNWLMPQGKKAEKQPNFKVKFQKVIDTKNKLVLLEFGGREYLTVIGNTNVLLDTFENGSVVSKDKFEQVFEENREKLNEYFKLEHQEQDSFKANAEKV